MEWKILIEPVVEAIMRQFPIEASGTIPGVAAIRAIFGIGVYMNETFMNYCAINSLKLGAGT